jgi:hypothetical protein
MMRKLRRLICPVGNWNLSLPALAGVLLVVAATAINSGWVGALEVLGGIVILTVLILWPKEVQELAPWLALPIWVILVMALGGTEAQEPFYSVSAQVIPVLVLSAAVGSSFAILRRNEAERHVRVVLLYGIALGEGYSLDAIASGTPSSGAFGIVTGALVAAGILVITEVLAREGDV